MKKLFAIALASIGLLSVIGLSACNDKKDSNSESDQNGGNVEESGNYSETFAGVFSEETYASTSQAAEAFLENEISSSDAEVTFVSYTKTADITDAELAGFDLGDVNVADIQSKEWGKVTYTLSETATVSAMSAPDNTRQVKVGMFLFGDVYRYFVPVAGNGEMISKSYFESVFESEKYKNCTAKYSMETRITMPLPGAGSQTVVTNLTYDLNIAETGVKFEFTQTQSGMGTSQTTHGIAYFIPTETGLTVYQKVDNGSWTRNYSMESQYDSLSDLYKMTLPDMLQFDYFEKTSTGFKLSPDKFQQFMEEYMENTIPADMLNSFNMNYDGEATYFVTEGRLSKSTIRMDVSMSITSGMTVNASVNASAANEFSDFGTTTVTIPAEVQALLNS